MSLDIKRNFESCQSRRFVLRLSLAIPVFALVKKDGAADPSRFVGSVVAEWGKDGRTMKLVRPFEFIDERGRRWPVPAGAEVDGASIPQVFWSIIGGPYEGIYRSASVIHDYYCFVRTRKYMEVHQVFYDAMISSGVRKSMAYLMYKAVEKFGPRWDDPKLDPLCEAPGENYDFELCAQNSDRPAVFYPPTTHDELKRFSSSLEGKIEKSDMDRLQQAIDDR